MLTTDRIVRMIGAAVVVATTIAPAAAQAPVSVDQERDTAQQPRPVDREHLRRQVYLMEGALARAVEYGAQLLNREIRTVSPEIVALAGNAKARGIYLEGYGVFFDVSVPVLLQSQMWTFKMMFDQNDPGLRDSIAGLKIMLKGTTDASQRRAIEYAIAQLEPRTNALATGNVGRPAAPAGQQGVGAAMLMPDPPAQAPTPPTASPDPQISRPTGSAAPPAGTENKPMTIDRIWLENPDRAYTEQIRTALIDTMLDWSAPMAIGPDEWLTVGAREDAQRDIFAPPEIYDQVVTVVLRIKGSDLAAFRAGKIDREEAKRRVQTREF